MHGALQQHCHLGFAAVNWLHIPVALLSMLLVASMVGHAIYRRRFDDLSMLTVTVSLALSGNAVICGCCPGRTIVMARASCRSRSSRNHKKLRRLYREERLQVRRRAGRKRALGARSRWPCRKVPTNAGVWIADCRGTISRRRRGGGFWRPGSWPRT
jgi:hypothetical protein